MGATTAPAARARRRPDRLVPADLAMLWPDDVGWPADVGLVVVLDGGPLVDDEGRLRIDDLRRHLVARLAALPRFQRVLVRPPWWQGLPYWVDAPSIDPAAHIGVMVLDPPAGDDVVLAACERLRRVPFDPDRPRWACWFLTGLADGKVALYARAHHTVVDGMSGIASLATVLDLVPTPAAEADAPAPIVAPPPTPLDLVVDRFLGALDAGARLARSLTRPSSTRHQLRDSLAFARRMLAAGSAPPTSLNRRVGPDRRLAVVRSDLEALRRVGHAEGAATVNDVLLSAVAGALRHLLPARGEPVDDDLVLKAMVPVSLHGLRTGPAEGNDDGGMLVPLPVGDIDSHRRLRRIAAATAREKAAVTVSPTAVPLLRRPVVLRTALRRADRQRMANVYVVDLPGLPVPAWFAGARVLEMVPVVPLSGNLALGVGALSYDGTLAVTVVADADAVPEVGVFVDGLRRSIDELVATTPTGADRAEGAPVPSP